MKLALAFSLLAASCFAGDRFQTAALDVQTAFTVNQSPDLPGMGKADNVVSISITTTDFSAGSFCVYALVSLEDGTTAGVKKCVDKDPFDKPVSLQFSTGTLKPVAWLRLLVTRMHGEPTDQLVNIFRHQSTLTPLM